MLSIGVPISSRRGPVARREVLRVGGLTACGLGMGELPGVGGMTTGSGTRSGRAKSCILLFLMGGPPQHSTWDPKPDAPAEGRG